MSIWLPTTAARGTKALTAAVGTVLALSLAACDPCSGIASCSGGGQYLSATGQIVDRLTGLGVDGARIDVVRVGGVDVAQDSLAVTTSGGGFWRVEFAPSDAGTLDVDVKVDAPGGVPYRVRGLRFATRQYKGDANLNQTWVTAPYFNYAGELFLRGTTDDRIQGRPIVFRLTGGVRTRGSGVQDSVFRASTDAGGRVELFPKGDAGGVIPLGADDLVGDLTVYFAAPMDSAVVRGLRLAPSYVYFDQVKIYRVAVGP